MWQVCCACVDNPALPGGIFFAHMVNRALILTFAADCGQIVFNETHDTVLLSLLVGANTDVTNPRVITCPASGTTLSVQKRLFLSRSLRI